MSDKTLVYAFPAVFLYISFLLLSCNTERKLSSLVYFNHGDTTLAKTIQNYEPVIQSGDRLSIAVNALDPASAAPFNLGSTPSPTAQSAGSANGGYIVEADGSIHFPQLGKVQVAGMQRRQLVDTLTARLVKYVTDPIVTVQFLNFKVTILGEVGRPGTLTIPDGKVTLVEAIGLAGDLPITARRDNIMVIREKNGQREFGHVNMLSKNLFSSPYYVLKQDDVVYVELTKEKVAAADLSATRLRNNISLVTTALSVVSTIVVLIVTLGR